MRKEYKQTTAIWLGICVIWFATYAVQLIALSVVRRTAPDLADSAVFRILLSTLPIYLVGTPLSLLVFRFADPIPPLEKRRLPLLAGLGVVAVCFALAVMGAVVGQSVNRVFSSVTGAPAANPVEEITRNVPFIVNFLVVAVAAPIMEELVYRKILIDRLRRYGEIPAVLISALVFGAIHGNFMQFFYAYLLGAVFGAVYCATGKLRYTVALHMMINGVSTISSALAVPLLTMENPTAREILANLPGLLWVLFLGLLYLASFIGAPFAAAWLIPRLRPARATVDLPREKALRVAFLNPALWLFLGFVIFLFFT